MSERSTEEIIAKAQALLAMANSPHNVHEAGVAAAKLQNLLFEHNLSMSHIETGNTSPPEAYGSIYVQVGEKHAKFLQWRINLLHILAENNFCKSVRITTTARVVLVGQQSNIRVVQTLYALLAPQLVRLADQGFERYQFDFRRKPENFRKRPVHGSSWKNSFYHGAVVEISRILRTQKQEDTHASAAASALVVVKDEALSNAVKAIFGEKGLVNTNQRPKIDSGAYNAGKKAANSLDLGQNKHIGGQRLALGAG